MWKTVLLGHVLWAESGVAFVVVDECVVGLLGAWSVKLLLALCVGASNIGARFATKAALQFGGAAAFGQDLVSMKAQLLDTAALSLSAAYVVFVLFILHFEESRTRQKTEQMTRQVLASSRTVLQPSSVFAFIFCFVSHWSPIESVLLWIERRHPVSVFYLAFFVIERYFVRQKSFLVAECAFGRPDLERILYFRLFRRARHSRNASQFLAAHFLKNDSIGQG